MSRKRLLFLSVVLLSAIGLAAISFAFLGSLGPNAKAYANLPRFKIPQLEAKSFTYIKSPQPIYRADTDILVVKRSDNSIDYWILPKVDNKFVLPDIHWFQMNGLCEDLSPDFLQGRILCKDNDYDKHFYDKYIWDLDGKLLSENSWVPDLERVKGKEVLGDFVIFHPKEK